MRAFKDWRDRKKPVYLCDDVRNSECTKDGCWYISCGPCKCTRKKKWAKRDSSGKPMLADADDIYNVEWMLANSDFWADPKSQKKQGL